nr:MAG TPA: hypothetical protein [Caudoviricetes sp.]
MGSSLLTSGEVRFPLSAQVLHCSIRLLVGLFIGTD